MRKRKLNDYIALSDNRIGILLTQGQIAIINSFQYYLIKNYTWYAMWSRFTKTFYSATTIDNQTISMHRLLMSVTDPEIEIDHKNGDTLDNTQNNLRLANHSEQQCNKKVYKSNISTGIKNISFREKDGYKVGIHKDNVRYQKYFKTLEEAIDWRDKMLPILHGDFNYKSG